MRAQAPGKLVLSGAYSVLEGAPAIVTAVDRYARADTAKPAEWVAEEVATALGAGSVPYCDASELRAEGRKLGLGSSAAILVASLAAVGGRRGESTAELRSRIFPIAVDSHRKAQQGGSGVDVAAATFGGTLICQLGPALTHTPARLPAGLQLRVFASRTAASTREMLVGVRQLKADNPRRYQATVARLTEAAESAAGALRQPGTGRLVDALAAQVEGFLELGEAAQLAIVTESGHKLWRAAERAGGVFAPAGAGGGDVSFWAGQRPMPEPLVQLAASLGWTALELSAEAEGAQRIDP